MFNLRKLIEEIILPKIPVYIITENSESIFVPKPLREKIAKSISSSVNEYAKK